MGDRLKLTPSLLFTVLVIVACVHDVPPLPIDVVVRPIGDADQCDATCAHWLELGCEEGEPSPEKGIPCVTVCRNTEEFEAQPHACFQAAESCDESRACEDSQ